MARILIVEDEPLISLMLEEWITELGHHVVGPVASLDEALRAAGGSNFDAAILDVNLKHQRCDPVADVLNTQAIPFAFATGGDADSVATRFAGRPMMSKPYVFESVRNLVDKLVRSPVPTPGPVA